MSAEKQTDHNGEQQQPEEGGNIRVLSRWPKRGFIRSRSRESIMSLSFSHDANILAVGCFGGEISTYDVQSGLMRIHTIDLLQIEQSLATKQRPAEERERLPVTGLAFRPPHFSSSLQSVVGVAERTLEKEAEMGLERSNSSVTQASVKRNLQRPMGSQLLVTASNGGWFLLDAQSDPAPELIAAGKEEGNEILTCAWSPSGERFCTAGRDATVRVYFAQGGGFVVGKQYTIADPSLNYTLAPAPQRVFSVSYATETTIVSAGWSGSIVVFDLNSKDGFVDPSRRHDVFGVTVTGNSIGILPRHDHHGEEEGGGASFLTSTNDASKDGGFDIFTASYRLDERLECYDGETLMKTGDMPWPVRPVAESDFMPVTAAASAGGEYVAFGGGGGLDADGAYVLAAPASGARAKAAAAARELKLAVVRAEHQKEAEHHAMHSESVNATAANNQQAVVQSMKAHQFHGVAQQPIIELRQPGKSVMAVAFGGLKVGPHAPLLVAFGDNGGVVQVFERPRK